MCTVDSSDKTRPSVCLFLDVMYTVCAQECSLYPPSKMQQHYLDNLSAREDVQNELQLLKNKILAASRWISYGVEAFN